MSTKTRSVSFGDVVEEQVFEADNADDYFQEGDEGANTSLATIPEGDVPPQEKGSTDTTITNAEEDKSSKTRATASAVSRLMCPNCGGRDIEQHDASGASVCTECGVVVEENAIVSAVEFVENSGGSSSMVGQFVSATSSKAYTGGNGATGGGGNMRGGRYGFSKDSRETTLANGRRRIQDVASRLRLGSHFVDAAHRLFTVAVEKNFVQGRRTTHVVAACLYISCRQEKSQHMLIDFSDALQVNVYTLGTTFLKFRRLLGLKLEIIDPALYVYRFAAHLDLDKKANVVALTALRLVGRMRRDWIVAGRRPAGICAAALLIAARAHGFSKQHQDVTRILRVCGLTVNTRVREFEQTSSAKLTLTQFNNVELDQEADPPSYTMNKLLEARAKAIQENNIDLLTSGQLDDPMGGKRATKWREGKLTDKKVKFKELYDAIEKDLQDGKGRMLLENGTVEDEDGNEGSSEKSTVPATSMAGGDSSKSAEENDNDKSDESEKDAAVTGNDLSEKKVPKDGDKGDGDEDDGDGKPAALEQQQLVLRDNLQITASKQWSHAYPRSKYGRALVLADHATEEERMLPVTPVEAKLSMSEWKEDIPGAITDEIDSMFRSEEEIAQKEVIFNKINKDYLELQERKENDRLSAETAVKDQEVDDAAQVEGHMRYLKSNRGRKRKNDGGEEELTTEEALLAAVANRKISRKINYDAMSAIFDDDGTFAATTDAAQPAEGEGALYGEV